MKLLFPPARELLFCLVSISLLCEWRGTCFATEPLAASRTSTNASVVIRWAGSGAFRLLVDVDPVLQESRPRDEMPADFEIDFAAVLAESSVSGTVDMASLQVMRIDRASGEPMRYDNFAYGRSAYDRPFSWYDAAIPYDFPEVFAPISYSDGRIKRTISPRSGYMYHAMGDWKRGHLAFVHTQDAKEPSRYAIYFDVLPEGQEPSQLAPRGWLGDGLPRRERWGESTTGADATKIALDDWNNDGLIDIVYGEQYGQLFYMPNRGTAERPEFPGTKMLFDTSGQPLDVGIHAAVLVVDWDGDGARDLLVGTYQNRVAFIKNVGTNADRRFEYQGLLTTADGQHFALPFRPVAQKPEGVFRHDYFPVMSAVDWNHDGKLDLIAGGYVTGRIYYYENVAADAGRMPELQLRGPLEADGAPINVRDWCAAPCIADLNGDDKPDIVSGSYTWLPKKKERPSFLRYYENIGTRAEPQFSERPFPFSGDLRSFRLPVPRATDWNSDGLTDLIVSSGANIFLFQNVGQPDKPVFDLSSVKLPSAWGNARLPSGQILDFNEDGLMDLVSGYTVHLNSGTGNPYRFDRTERVLPAGVHIDHPIEKGDGHFFPYLADLNRDGRTDVLFGDWHGNIWFHANLSTASEKRFDVSGHRLETEDGKFIKVGPIAGDTENDFQALQGARTVFTLADYDNDDRLDLVIGDTYGKVRYFRNLGPTNAPRFAVGQLVGDMGFRLLVDSVDWNADGRMDVVAGASNHRVSVFLNTGRDERAAFDKRVDLQLPKIKETRVRMVDLNRDGDQDLLVMSTQGLILVERSFLDHGYATASFRRLEKKP